MPPLAKPSRQEIIEYLTPTFHHYLTMNIKATDTNETKE